MYQVVRILELSFSLYPVLIYYHVTIQPWPLTPTLINNKQYLTLIIVINCTKLYDPGSYGSVCIPPTMVFFLPWPWPLTLLENQSIFFSPCWSNVPSCKILGLSVRSTRPGQTDGRRYTIIRPVKDGRIKKKQSSVHGFCKLIIMGHTSSLYSHNQQSVIFFIHFV